MSTLIKLEAATRAPKKKTKMIASKEGVVAHPFIEGTECSLDARSDDELGLALMIAQDPTAYLELLARYEHRSFWFAPRGCPDHVVEVLSRCLDGAFQKCDDVRSFERFFVACVKNEWKKSERRRRRTIPIVALDEDRQPPDRHDLLEEIFSREIRECCASAIADLSRCERVALTERYLNGLTYRDATDKLGWPQGRMQRACERGQRLLVGRLSKQLGLVSRAATSKADRAARGPAPADVHHEPTVATRRGA